MDPAWSVVDGHIVLSEEVQPSTLLTNGFGRRHEIGQGSMVSADDDGASKQMLPILFQAENHTEQLSTGNAIPSLGGGTKLYWHSLSHAASLIAPAATQPLRLNLTRQCLERRRPRHKG